jgi:hypothetical protein
MQSKAITDKNGGFFDSIDPERSFSTGWTRWLG